MKIFEYNKTSKRSHKTYNEVLKYSEVES